MNLRLFIILSRCIRLGFFWMHHRTSSDFHERFSVKLRKTLEDLGPTFIKLGQMLSMRPDFILDIYCTELESLLDRAPKLPTRIIRRRVEQELKKPISNVFQKFYNSPIACASLSQVHRAILWNGDSVAVKVLRPGVERMIKRDIAVLKLLARLCGNKIGKMPGQYWLSLVDQLAVWLRQETDYIRERDNMEIMRKQLSVWDDIFTPDVYLEWSTKRVLVMEFIDAWSLNDLIRMKNKGELPSLQFDLCDRIAKLGDQTFVTSLRDGYAHGDCHPGNIFVTEDGKVGIIDFGLIQYFDVHLRNHMVLFMLGATFASPELIVRASKRMCTIPDDFDEESMYRKFSEICDHYRDVPASEMSNAQFLVLCINECLKQGLIIPWPLVIFARTTTGFDGIILKLFPEYVFSSESRPLFVRLYLQGLLRQFCTVPKFISILDDLQSVADDASANLRTFMEAFSGVEWQAR